MKKRSIYVRILRKIKRFIFPTPSPDEIKLRKQQRDYDFLTEHGVDTKFGYVELFGDPIIYVAPGAKIVMEEGITLISDSNYNWAGINHPVILSASEGAEIILHKGVGLSGTSIVSVEHVEIGENTMLGVNTNVYETDFHPLNKNDRQLQTSIMNAQHAPIHIGNNCWLGSNVTVLKGVSLGNNVVVSAMSLVNKDAPDDVIIGGVPAKVIKKN